MLNLPNTTLICMSGIGHKAEENAKSLIESQKGIEFGAVKYIQLGEIKDIDSWNKAIIYELPKYIETTHAMLVHGDGMISDSSCWDDRWLSLDYIGSPWPLPQDNYSYRSESGKIQRVGNSVSLRSKKLMDLAATRPVLFRYGNNNEDGHICCWNREWLESQGCKFATFEEAIKFGKEAPLPENEGINTFVYHKYG